jgi:hypothetical protein
MQFFEMPLYFGRTESEFRLGYNGSEGSVIVQKQKKILGLLNPGLNFLPIFEKMFHHLLLQRKPNLILSPDTMNARTIDPKSINRGYLIRKYSVFRILFLNEGIRQAEVQWSYFRDAPHHLLSVVGANGRILRVTHKGQGAGKE